MTVLSWAGPAQPLPKRETLSSRILQPIISFKCWTWQGQEKAWEGSAFTLTLAISLYLLLALSLLPSSCNLCSCSGYSRASPKPKTTLLLCGGMGS